MTDPNYALTHLYHPSGAKISIPITIQPGETYSSVGQDLVRAVSSLIEAGLLVNMPGLDEGELVDEVVSVACRMSKDNTKIVAFYKAHPKLEKKFIHEYLDTPEQIADFEAATGLRLASLPVFDGDKDITKDHRNAAKYIIPLPRPVKLVYRVSDRWKKWNETDGQGQQPQKYELLRYMTTGAMTQAPAVTVIPPAMSYEEAQKVTSPNGAELGTLDAEKLNILANSRAANVTDTMRQAANIILKEMQLEGA